MGALPKPLMLTRHHAVVDGGDGGDGHHAAAGGADVILLQLVAAGPVSVRHLRDDLVTTTIQVEEVQIAATQHDAEAVGGVLHADAELLRLVVVDLDVQLWAVELEISIHVIKHTALAGRIQQLLGDGIDGLVVIRGTHHVGHAALAGAR